MIFLDFELLEKTGGASLGATLLTLLLLLFAEVTVPLGDSVGPNGTMPAGALVPGASLIPIGAAVTAGDTSVGTAVSGASSVVVGGLITGYTICEMGMIYTHVRDENADNMMVVRNKSKLTLSVVLELGTVVLLGLLVTVTVGESVTGYHVYRKTMM